ncbi:MAG: glutathione S-transferase family protein [Nitratireductor sp.]|nr:glutathione S-transferase family protein [Nitratireductor sp.]
MTIRFYDLVGSDPARPFSPHCWKVHMALTHKALDFERIPVCFTQIPALEGGVFKTLPAITNCKETVSDSMAIAVYLKDKFSDRGSHLFHGEGGVALSRFVEAWTNTQLHMWIRNWALLDILEMLSQKDQAYFRISRETRYGKPLEEIVAGRETTVPELLAKLEPFRAMLASQPFLGGKEPAFADYIVFGAFQWLRVCSGLHMIPASEPVLDWVNRMLDLHDGLARSVSEASA